MPEAESDKRRPSYVSLVAALRSEFGPGALEALSIVMRQHLHSPSSVSTLARAVYDANDINYDAGDLVHPAVKKWLERHGPQNAAPAAASAADSTAPPKHPYWPDMTDDEGDALNEWFDDTCSDCIEGRCHFGGERSKRSIEAAQRGEEYVDPEFGACGCTRHRNSLLARSFWRDNASLLAAAVAWRAAKQAGEVELEVDEDA